MEIQENAAHETYDEVLVLVTVTDFLLLQVSNHWWLVLDDEHFSYVSSNVIFAWIPSSKLNTWTHLTLPSCGHQSCADPNCLYAWTLWNKCCNYKGRVILVPKIPSLKVDYLYLIPLCSAWICISRPPVDLKSLPHHLQGKVLVLVWMVSMCLWTLDGLEKDLPHRWHRCSVSWWLVLLWNANPDWLLYDLWQVMHW